MRLPLLLVLTLVLAGCASPDAEVEPAASNETVSDGTPLPPVDERVDDGTRLDLGHMPHLHDYWMGRERVTLFDDTVENSRFDPIDTFFTATVERSAKAGNLYWNLPEGALVYEGTGVMEITLTWSEPTQTSVGVTYRTPGSAEWQPLAKVESGKALVIELTPDMTDMPHSKMSRWAFEFEAYDSPGAFLGAFHLKVDIVKMRDIGLFPPHPQLFEGKPEKVLHDVEHAFSEVSYAKRTTNLITEGEFPEKDVTLASLVPMETLWMHVSVDILEATASPGQVSEIRFFYAGANKPQLGHPTVLPIAGSLAEKHLEYAFPVSMDETDTPYGNESQWRMFVEPATTFTGRSQEPDCGGCTDVSIRYRLLVTAYDHVPADAVASKLEGED